MIASLRGITETDRGRQVLHVAKPGITAITLRHGCSSHRPLLELILGLAFLLTGLWGLPALIRNPGAFRIDLMFVFLGLIGAMMLFDVMKRRFFLEIVSGNTTTKIPFSKDADITQIREFCSNLEHKWQYNVKVAV